MRHEKTKHQSLRQTPVHNAAVLHLRTGGGNCWDCKGVIRSRDNVSLVLHLTSAGGRVGFAHYRCLSPR